jgi:hypothetical protein
MGEIIQAVTRFRPRRKRQRQKSQYELYPLPFFNRDACCTWDVRPTGDYTADCKTGQRCDPGGANGRVP